MTLNIEKLSPHWLLVLKNREFQYGQICIIFCPGIGEQLKKSPGTGDAQKITALQRIYGLLDMPSTPRSIAEAVDGDPLINLISVAPLNEYENGEIEQCIRYAKDVLKASGIKIIFHSLGGFGTFDRVVNRWEQIYNSKNPTKKVGYDTTVADNVDTIVSVSPGQSLNAAMREQLGKKLAEKGIKVWYIVHKLDTVTNGDLGLYSRQLYDATIKAGGQAVITEYNYPVTDRRAAHNIFEYVISNLTTPLARPSGVLSATGINNPLLNVFQFMFANNKTRPLISPVKDWRTVKIQIGLGDGAIPTTTTTSTTTTEQPSTTTSSTTPPPESTTTTTSTTKTEQMEQKLGSIVISKDGERKDIVEGHYTNSTDTISESKDGKVKYYYIKGDNLRIEVNYYDQPPRVLEPNKK
jgi:hypothetical protein